MNFSYSDSEDDELEVVVDGYGGHESFNNEEEMVDDDGSEPEGGENSHHDLDRLATEHKKLKKQKQIKKQIKKQVKIWRNRNR